MRGGGKECALFFNNSKKEDDSTYDSKASKPTATRTTVRGGGEPAAAKAAASSVNVPMAWIQARFTVTSSTRQDWLSCWVGEKKGGGWSSGVVFFSLSLFFRGQGEAWGRATVSGGARYYSICI